MLTEQQVIELIEKDGDIAIAAEDAYGTVVCERAGYLHMVKQWLQEDYDEGNPPPEVEEWTESGLWDEDRPEVILEYLNNAATVVNATDYSDNMTKLATLVENIRTATSCAVQFARKHKLNFYHHDQFIGELNLWVTWNTCE